MSTYQISHKTELMQNYLHADVMGPQEKFLALQTNLGASLLFSISTEKVFYVTKEIYGDIKHRHGWNRSDLRGDQIKQAFPQGKCKDFAAAQCAHASTATIQLALVIDDGTNDHLYLSLGNSDSDTSWTEAPKWKACPFNATDGQQKPLTPPQPFKIANVFISEATDLNHIVVDVIRDPQNAGPLISRYFIDVANPESPVWQAHDVDIQMEAKGCKTCIGRRQPEGQLEKKSPSDGLYTSGVVSGHSQFTYKPLKSPYGEPKSTILKLTADLSPPSPDAIAACRKPDHTSDLYAAHGGCLYFFASDKQFNDDDSVARKIVENKLFTDVKDLFASLHKEMVTVWGRNGSDDIFYTTCPVDHLTTPASWSTPLAIMTGVQNVTPYVNRADTAKIFFAHTQANEFKIAMKSPRKNGSWRVRNVHLPPSQSKQPAQSYKSYTTRVTVTDDNNHPAADVGVVITSTNRTSVYINHLYYVVGPISITVKTDRKGSLTIVEEVTRLDGTQLSLSIDGDRVSKPCSIDPMVDSPYASEQLKKLKSESDLNNAWIYYQNKNLKPRRKLVKVGVDGGDLSSAGKNLENLWKTHDHLQGKTTNSTLAFRSPDDRSPEYQALVKDKPITIVDGGDLLSKLDSMHAHHLAMAFAQGGTSTSGWWLWDAIVDFFNEVWNFVIKIEEEIFMFIFETIEQVFEVFKYIFNKVVENLRDLLEYASYLFEWDDIERTKDVMKNVILRALDYQVDGIKSLKQTIDEKMLALVQASDDWAGLDWGAKMGAEGKEALSSKTAPSPAQSAPDWFLADHFEANIEDAASENTNRLTDPPTNPLDVIVAAIKSEANLGGEVLTELEKLGNDIYTLSLSDFVKRLAGIVAHFGFTTAKIIIDAILDIIYDIAKATIKLLDFELYIPVVSDFLDLCGVPRFSLLDVISYIGAIPTTVVYKFMIEQPPFPDNADTRFLIEAKDFQSVLNRFAVPERTMGMAALGDSLPATGDSMILKGVKFDETATNMFLGFRFLSGFFGLLGAGTGPVDALAPAPNVAVINWLGIANVSMTLVGGTSQFVSGFYWPQANLTSNETFFCRLVATVRLCALTGLNEPFRSIFNQGSVWRKICLDKSKLAFLDMGFGFVSGLASIFNLMDLYNPDRAKKHDPDILQLGKVEEFGNLSAYAGRISRYLTINTTPPANYVLAVVNAVLQGTYAATQFYIFGRMVEIIKKAKS
jgi:hypothetical protein